MEHDAIVAGLDLAQDQTLDFAQRLLYLRLLIRRHTLLGQLCLIEREAKELLRWRQQCQQHATGQVQTSACADAIPRHRIRLFVVCVRLVRLWNQIRNCQPCGNACAVQVVIAIRLQAPVALFC